MTSGFSGKIHGFKIAGQFRLTETSYPARFQLSSHSHDLAAFVIVMNGVWREQYGLQSLYCPAGSVYYRPALAEHTNVTEHGDARCLTVEIAPTWLRHMKNYGPFLSNPISAVGSDIEFLTHRMHMEWQDVDDLTPLVIEGILCEVVARFGRRIRAPHRGLPPPWLRRVHELLCNRFAETLSLREISEQAGVHRVHVARHFRRYYGMTIGDFVRQIRIRYACDQLLRPKLPIVEIALAAGFAHQAHFTTVFKRTIGLTPKQFRMLKFGTVPRCTAESFPAIDVACSQGSTGCPEAPPSLARH